MDSVENVFEFLLLVWPEIKKMFEDKKVTVGELYNFIGVPIENFNLMDKVILDFTKKEGRE
jgi:hypothetical protein